MRHARKGALCLQASPADTVQSYGAASSVSDVSLIDPLGRFRSSVVSLRPVSYPTNLIEANLSLPEQRRANWEIDSNGRSVWLLSKLTGNECRFINYACAVFRSLEDPGDVVTG